MPATLIEPRHNGEALVSEANGSLSRETVTVPSGTGVVGPNKVMGKITANGKYVPLAPAANDGSQTAAGVTITDVDATSADAPVVIWARVCELKGGILDYGAANAGQITQANTDLAAKQIAVRKSI